jgi:purine-binding chemotaxis protein CheW
MNGEGFTEVGPRALDEGLSSGLCAFWMAKKLFGLDVGLASEIVIVEGTIPVPASPSFVLGLFNLRGVPIALLDLAEVLGFSHAMERVERPTALVVRRGDLLVAFVVDRMHAVLPSGKGTVTAPNADEHPAIASFVTLDEGLVVTVLDPQLLLERISAMRLLEEAN